MKIYFSRLHYNKTPAILDKALMIFLLPASFFYGLAVFTRNFLYDTNLVKTEKLPAFVISIGNLTTGGTGKTPVTAKIACCLTKELKKKTAVISRGYGGKLSIKKSNIISNGSKIFFDAEMAGDEPFWIAENSKDTVVITGKNRYKSGKYAIEKFNSEVLILDDGFQYRKLHRNLNILLIDCDKVSGNNFLLPAGPLREPEDQIKRADKVVIVNKSPYLKPFEEKVNVLREILKDKYNKESCVCEFMADGIYDIITKQPFNGFEKVVAFSGIARPESFFSFLEDMQVNLAAKKIFPDHHIYTKTDIQALIDYAESVNADAVITTEKDSVKIRSYLKNIETKIPVCALKLKANLDIREIIPSSLYSREPV